MLKKLTLKYKKVHPDARIDPPYYLGDAGHDVYAVEEVFVPFGEKREIPIGIAFETPEGYYLTLETRSGHGVVKGLRMHRSIIDSGFRGCFTVVVYNHACKFPHENQVERYGYTVKKGEKIGQIVIHKTNVLELEECQELAESKRGQKCWGSTDVKK